MQAVSDFLGYSLVSSSGPAIQQPLSKPSEARMEGQRPSRWGGGGGGGDSSRNMPFPGTPALFERLVLGSGRWSWRVRWYF